MSDSRISRRAVQAVGVIVATFILLDNAPAQSRTGEGAAAGAGWGALAGLVFGDDIDDVVDSSIVGGVAGAVVGSAQGREEAAEEQADYERSMYEMEAQRRADTQAEYSKQLTQEQQKLADERALLEDTSVSSQGIDPDLLARAFGRDTVIGWNALHACRYDEATLAAIAGENAEVASHQLAAVWLRAVVALDQNQANSANSALQAVIDIDPDIATLAEAQAAADELLAEVRDNRESAGITCQS